MRRRLSPERRRRERVGVTRKDERLELEFCKDVALMAPSFAVTSCRWNRDVGAEDALARFAEVVDYDLISPEDMDKIFGSERDGTVKTLLRKTKGVTVVDARAQTRRTVEIRESAHGGWARAHWSRSRARGWKVSARDPSAEYASPRARSSPPPRRKPPRDAWPRRPRVHRRGDDVTFPHAHLHFRMSDRRVVSYEFIEVQSSERGVLRVRVAASLFSSLRLPLFPLLPLRLRRRIGRPPGL